MAASVDEMLACGCGCSRVAKAEIERLRATLQQIAAFSGPTLREYDNAVNVIRDMQWVANEALANARSASTVEPVVGDGGKP